MNEHLPKPLRELADAFALLPSIGKKSAVRLAMHVFESSPDEAQRFSKLLTEIHSSLRRCTQCFNVSEDERCPICSDSRREHSLLCVVEQPLDVFSIEQSGQYRGLYHVLGGVLSPADGIGPSDIRLEELAGRVLNGSFSEVILAMNPSMEGEATANYLNRLLKPSGVKITRLARGIPSGGLLEYTDEHTLGSAFEGRTIISP